MSLSPFEARRNTRRAWLLARLGDPHLALGRVITVAGTNGKGSTIAFLAAMLRAAGHRVAAFTSPDLHGPHERFSLPEGPMAPEAYVAGMQALGKDFAAAEAAFPDLGPLGAFERWATLAWVSFAQAQPEVVLVEAGVGGRGDAVDVFPQPLATLFSAVGADHMARLGGDMASVVAHKAGLMRPGVVAIASASGEGSAGLAQAAQLLGAPFQAVTPWSTQAPASWGDRLSQGLAGAPNGQAAEGLLAPWVAQCPAWGPLSLGLCGQHQGANAALAVAALPRLAAAGLVVSEAQAKRGLAGTAWPGRMELVRDPEEGGWWLLDVAHNAPAAAALAASWGQPGLVALAAQASKDGPALLRALSGPPVLVAPVPGAGPGASWAAEALQAEVPSAGPLESLPDAQAVKMRARVLAPTALRVATGSVYWVAAMREALGLARPCDPAWREANPGG